MEVNGGCVQQGRQGLLDVLPAAGIGNQNPD